MKLGSQGLEVSAQGLGCYCMTGGYGSVKPESENISLIHHAIQNGVTFRDTSDIYGPYTNEILLGKVYALLLISKPGWLMTIFFTNDLSHLFGKVNM